jgi:hypothetical protein
VPPDLNHRLRIVTQIVTPTSIIIIISISIIHEIVNHDAGSEQMHPIEPMQNLSHIVSKYSSISTPRIHKEE